MSEVVVAIAITAIIVSLGAWFYNRLSKIEADLKDSQIVTSAALQEASGKIGGYKDHITAMRVDLDLMEKTLAEALKMLDADELSRIKDRLGLCEMTVGIRRGDKAKVS